MYRDMSNKIITYLNASQKVSQRAGRIVPLLLLFLMLAFGDVNVWGQTDYSGTYYIAFYGNSSSGDIYLDELDKNYYLCPTEGWIYYDYKNSKDDFTATDTSRPFLTTYQWLKQATYDINEIKWTITKNGEYYNLCNGSGKYLVANGSIRTSGANRLRVHLEETNPSINDNTNFTITKTGDYYFISPKNFKVSNTTCYLNVTEGNKDSLKGASSTKNDGPDGYKEIAGTIGFWNQANNTSQCAFIIPSPTFSLNNDNKVEITALGDAEIYYTTDGSNPVVPAESASPSTPTKKYTGAIDLVNGQIMIKAIATNKDHRVVSSSVATYVYNPDITWSETSFVYNGSPQTPTDISVKVGDIVVDATKYSTSCSNNTNAGTATLKLSDNDDKDYYHIVEKSVNFTIEKASISPTVSVAAKTYDGTVVTPSVSGNSGNGTVTYAYKVKGADDATYSETAPINAGEYTVKASIAETTNYLSGEATVDFTIAKAPLTVTAKNHSITYGDAPAGNGVTYEDFVNSETASVLDGTLAYDYSYTQFGDVGNTYTITPKGLTSNNYDISFEAGTLTVDQREIGLTWSETTSFPYDGLEHAPTAIVTGLVNNDEVGVTVSDVQTNAGNYTATASALTGEKAGNYKLPIENTHAFTITPVELSVTAKNHTITYGDVPADNGVTYEGFVNSETESVLGGSLGYDYSYTQYGDVSNTYTITPSGLTSDNYYITFTPGVLTVTPKTIGVEWTDTELSYNGSEQAPTATATGLVNNDEVGVTVTGAQTNVGTDYVATASALTGEKKDNYQLPEGLTHSFTITPKSIGDGNKAADDIIIELSPEGELSVVKQGEKILVENTDYTQETEVDGDDKIITITGMGNYTGSVKALFANPVFTDPDGTGSEKAAAVYTASRDLSAPAGIEPYIVRKVNPSIGTLVISKLGYIPEGVPVLLLSNAESEGFVASPKDPSIPEVTVQTKNSNQLKVSQGGETVEAAQIYMFYKGEFVLTKAGTLGKGKYYLYNPNFKVTPSEDEEEDEPGDNPAGSRGVLRIVFEDETTGIDDLKNEKTEERKLTGWYSLDGRRLSGKPTKGGIYIHKGQKIYIKR